MAIDEPPAPSDRLLQSLGFHFRVPALDEVDVVVVDDDRTSLEIAQAYVRRVGHRVRAFTRPTEALDAIRDDPPQILVTDMVMPGLSGIDLAGQARTVDPDIKVVLVTAYGDMGTRDANSQLGISAFLTKPLDLEDLRRALQQCHVERAAADHHRAMVNWMYDRMASSAREIRDVTLGTLASLMNALDARSPHFRGHSRAVALQAAAVAEELGLDEQEVESVRIAGMLHDIGMIGVPDAIVDKPQGLTPAETALIRSHCEAGVEIIAPMKHIGPSTRYVLEHHERLDGSGYPDGKIGEEISRGGQIVGIAEAWIAILENRAYRRGRSREEGMQLLLAHEGQWFDEAVTEALSRSDIGLL